jgi:hypothetical protein
MVFLSDGIQVVAVLAGFFEQLFYSLATYLQS